MYSILVVWGFTERWEVSCHGSHGVGAAMGTAGVGRRVDEGARERGRGGSARDAALATVCCRLLAFLPFSSPLVLSTRCIQQQNGAHPFLSLMTIH